MDLAIEILVSASLCLAVWDCVLAPYSVSASLCLVVWDCVLAPYSVLFKFDVHVQVAVVCWLVHGSAACSDVLVTCSFCSPLLCHIA